MTVESSVPVGSTGDALRTFAQTTSEGIVQTEAVALADTTDTTQVARVKSEAPAADDAGLVVRVAGIVDASQKQLLDAGNSAAITSASALGATPGSVWVGAPFITRANGVQECLTVLAATDASGDFIADLGGTFTFYFAEDDNGTPLAPYKVVKPETYRSFACLKTPDYLTNVGYYYWVSFEPSRPLAAGETVYIDTQHATTSGNSFKLDIDDVLEEESTTMNRVRSFLSVFNPRTKNSINLRADEGESLHVVDKSQHTTPSGAIYTEGFRRQIEHIFSRSRGAEAISRLQDLSSGGTVSHIAVRGQALFETSTDAGNYFEFFSDSPAHYESGQAIGGSRTTRLAQLPIGDEYFEWGWSDLIRENGTGWGVDATGWYTWRMVNSAYESKTYQTNWNRDKGNGLSPSLFKKNFIAQAINALKNNLTFEEFEWYGADSHQYFMKPPQATPPLLMHVDELPNNIENSSLPDPDLYMFVSGYNDPAAPRNLQLYSGSWRGGIYSSDGSIIAQGADGTDDKIGRDGSGSGLNVHIIGITPDFKLGALRTPEFGHLNVGPTRVPIPPPANTAVKGLSVVNLDANTDVFIGGALCTATQLSHAILARGGWDVELDGVEQMYLIADAAGAATSTADRYGTTTVNSGTVDPTNILAETGLYTTFDDQSDSVRVSGYTAAGAFPEISSVVMHVKGKKGTNATTETVALDGSGAGRTTGASAIVSDGNLPGGTSKMVLAFISRNASNTISGVTAGGVSLAQLASKVTVGGRDMECWWGYGTFGATSVAVTMDSATNAHLAWFQFSHADNATPLISAGATGTGTAVAASGVSGTNKGFAVMSVSHESASGTAGVGYTEATDETNGTGSNVDSLYTETKPLTTTATENGTATLNASSTWAAITVTVAPMAAMDPVLTLTYEVDGTAGLSSLTQAFSSTTDVEYTVDITGDRAWTAADIGLFTAIPTASTLNAADLLLDSVWLAVTEIEADVVAHCTYAWLAEPPA